MVVGAGERPAPARRRRAPAVGRRRRPPAESLSMGGVRRSFALVPLFALLAACGGDEERASPPPTATVKRPATGERTATGPARNRGGPRVETVATGLEVPWEIAFLPDGSALVTERPGRVRLLSRDLRLRDEPVAEVDVDAIGEGGLLGLAVDPDFERNRFVYLYRTANGGNEVARYRFEGGRLEEAAVVARGIRAAAGSLAQDRGSLNGKVLRLSQRQYRGGGRARPEVFSLGHRNPQGFDWQPRTNRFVEDEHGDQGNDEVNLLRRGANYGWPEAQGEDHDGFAAPLAVYPDAIAPSGATFVRRPGSAWTGDYLIGALVGEQVRRLSFDGARVTRNEALFEADFGRVRTVVEGPDGALYALTSNRDGRGAPREGG
jgi:glucose/arabinose dehydrogenase